MVLLLILLLTGIVKLEMLGDVTAFFTKNLTFFFLPALVELMENVQPVRDSLLPILCVMVLSTVVTFGVTAGVVRLLTLLLKRKGEKA